MTYLKFQSTLVFGLGGGAGWGHSFSVLIFKYLIILYCPIISAPPKGPRILCLPPHLPPPPHPTPPQTGAPWARRGGACVNKPFLHSLSIYKLGKQPFSLYIYIFSFLIPQCCKYHQRGYGRVLCFFLIYCRCKQNFKNKI